MERYLKIVRNLSRRQKNLVIDLWQRILKNDLKELKIKKLRGFDNYYSVRRWKLRIVFSKNKMGNEIVNINYRKNIYKEL